MKARERRGRKVNDADYEVGVKFVRPIKHARERAALASE